MTIYSLQAVQKQHRLHCDCLGDTHSLLPGTMYFHISGCSTVGKESRLCVVHLCCCCQAQYVHNTLHYVTCSGDTNSAGLQEDFHGDLSLDVMKATMQHNQCDL